MRLIDRAAQALNAIADSPAGVALTDLASQVGLPASTTHRLLAALSENRLVYQGSDARYRIGPGVLRLAQAFERHEALVAVARPYLEQTSKEINESVFLSGLVGGEVVCMATAEVPRLLTFFMRVSERTPYHAGASARAILAFRSPEFITEALQRETMTRYTDRTPTTIPEVVKVLRDVQRNGYAVCDEEMEVGVTALAAPIFDLSGQAVAALTAVAPSDRLSGAKRADAVACLQSCALRVSEGLGYTQALSAHEESFQRA
jgi:DNA-binding IclR family transcriptional regulator